MSLITHRRTTPLGDTVVTRRYYFESRCTREDITIEGPPELIDAPRGGNSGRDIYHFEERPVREIWHVPGRYP